MLRTLLAFTFAWNLAGCSWMKHEPVIGAADYEERKYCDYDTPMTVTDVETILRQKVLHRGVIDLQKRELTLSVSEPQRWGGLPPGAVHLRHSADIWRLRKPKIGYLDLYLVRRGADGVPERIAQRRMADDGDMWHDKPDLIKHARAGDLILGMRGF